jgi:hypothetical protein
MANQSGFTILGSAADGLAAYQMALDLLPHVPLLDNHMPKLNGSGVAQNTYRAWRLRRLLMRQCVLTLCLVSLAAYSVQSCP